MINHWLIELKNVLMCMHPPKQIALQKQGDA